MGTWDDLFRVVEDYERMSIDALQYSKIGKGERIVVDFVSWQS